MLKITCLCAFLLATCTNAFAPIQLTSSKGNVFTFQLQESFGTGLGVDMYEMQDPLIGGEASYKQWVNKVNENNMLNRKYNVIGRVRELNLLKATTDNGILSKLEANGVDLVTIEKLLPLAEEYGLLSIAANNQQLLINLAAPLLIEPAPILIPVIAGALKAGPSAFFAAAAAFGGLEVLLLANDVEIPLIGLPAASVFGLLLVPLALISGAAGAALASAKK